ncbi:MAG: prepilin-type N-terminal cleavage/methylation domain-containing protein [Myxococcales bacterium]|nr:prepilin-type N-terminal cleavage/methylation domain-containing protein [Myxococcales bacterium]
MRKHPNDRMLRTMYGMTLMEVMIVLVVIGLIMGVSIPSYNSLTHMRLRESSTKLAGTIRYLHNQATLKGLCMRLVFDLHKDTYRVEASTDGECLVDSEQVTARQAKKKEEDAEKKRKEEEEKRKSGTTPNVSQSFWGEEPPISLEVKKATFSQYNSKLLKARKLPQDISFESVYVSHQKEPYSKKQGPRYAYIHCFPLGFCERAVIFLQDTSKTIFSLEVKPLTGRVAVHNGKIDLRDAYARMGKGDDNDINR